MTEDQTTNRSPFLSLKYLMQKEEHAAFYCSDYLQEQRQQKKMKYYKGFIIGKMNERLKMKMCVCVFFCFQK